MPIKREAERGVRLNFFYPRQQPLTPISPTPYEIFGRDCEEASEREPWSRSDGGNEREGDSYLRLIEKQAGANPREEFSLR